jgi:hypothetical protein
MTQVSWTRQLGLAALLVVLGLLATWMEFKHRPEKEAQEEQAKKIFSLKETPVHSIRLSQGLPTRPDFEFSCLDLSAKLCKPGEQSKWQITHPSQLRADDAAVNSLLSTLNHLNSIETISLKDETPQKRAALLKDYSLDPESLKVARKIEITTDRGTFVLYLGSTHPIGNDIFAVQENVPQNQKSTGKIDDSLVYLIPNYLKANLDYDLGHWRDKKLLTLATHEIEAFQIDRPKSPLSGERKTSQWSLKTAQGEIPGDSDQVSALLSSATFLTATQFIADSKKDPLYGETLKGSSRILSLILHPEKGSQQEAPAPITLSLFRKSTGKSTFKLYATVSNMDPLFEVEIGAMNRLDKSAKDLRLAKLMTTLERFNVKRLEFSGAPFGSSPLKIHQAGGKWVSDSDSQELDSTKIQTLLDQLAGARIQEFLSDSHLPPGESSGLVLTVSNDQSSKKWSFWKKATGPTSEEPPTYARDAQSHQHEIFLMDKALTSALPWNRDFFKKIAPTPTASAQPPAVKH